MYAVRLPYGLHGGRDGADASRRKARYPRCALTAQEGGASPIGARSPKGLAVGYRKGAKGGTWIARHYSAEHGRRFHSIGTADDIADADGAHVLSFAQAQEAARKWFAHLARHDRGEVRSGPYTVRECLEDYLTWLQGHRKTAGDARYRVDAHIVPKLGEIQCDRLTTAEIQKWLRDLAASPARLRTKKDAKKPNYPGN